MNSTASRLFTLLCVVAMLLGLAAAAWARSGGQGDVLGAREAPGARPVFWLEEPREIDRCARAPAAAPEAAGPRQRARPGHGGSPRPGAPSLGAPSLG